MDTSKFQSVDEYISSFDKERQALLQEIRGIIRSAAPKATEVISYNMPAFKQHKVLVYYAAYEHHIGFYPTGSPIAAFKEKLSKYKTSKGAIQFPIDQPLPKGLIKEIVRFRLKEDEEAAKLKLKKVK
jgi:uncharacterized protein YdhG (YjbR/CyaY superfamily)